MPYLKPIVCLCALAALPCGVVAGAMGPNINLGGRADAVLPDVRRQAVLEVAEKILQREEAEFALIIGDLPNPFVYDSRRVVAEVEEAPEAPAPVVFSDQAVLERIAPNFSSRITGRLTRGGVPYLQVRGGQLYQAGNEFRVSLPGIREEPYAITIHEVRSNSFVLGLNDARIDVPMPGSEDGSGVRLDTPTP